MNLIESFKMTITTKGFDLAADAIDHAIKKGHDLLLCQNKNMKRILLR